MRGNPKSEIRSPKEGRNPKPEQGQARLASAIRRRLGLWISVFGFPSDFLPSGGS